MIGNAGSLAVMCYVRKSVQRQSNVSPAQVSPMRAGMLLCARNTIFWQVRPEGKHGQLLGEVTVGVETERVMSRAEAHKLRLAIVCFARVSWSC